MGLFTFLLRQLAGRAEARADLVNVGAHGTLADLHDLQRFLPPLDAFGETASDAVLRILDRASRAELLAWASSTQLQGSRFSTLQPEDVASSRDLGTLALAVFHPRDAVRAVAIDRLRTTDGMLAAKLVGLRD